MSDKIRVLIVDDIPETRENVRKLLQFESDLEVIGYAGTGEEAVEKAKSERPDIVLMDINMPDADGIVASQMITKSVAGAQVIIMSVQSEADYLRRAMLAGARDFLMKPFSGDELVGAIRDVHASRPIIAPSPTALQLAQTQGTDPKSSKLKNGKVVAFFSPKGGNGCTTLAVNVAVALAESNHNTLLIDGSLQFGDVGVMLNLKSLTSVIDLIDHVGELDEELVSSVITSHQSGLGVLLAPPRPEMAELVTAEMMRALLRHIRLMFDYIIIDTTTVLSDVILAMLDEADRIVLLTRQDLPSLKNVSRFFDLSEVLDYGQDKVFLVVNHASKKPHISVKDIEETLKWPAAAVIPEEVAAYSAADQGRPLVSDTWQKRAGAKAIVQLSKQLVKDLKKDDKPAELAGADGTSRLNRLFGR